MGNTNRPLTADGQLDYAGYYRDRAGANYVGAALADFPCANGCPAVVRADNRTGAQGAFPAGKGWVFRTTCFTGLLNLDSGRACVCGWPHSQASVPATCGTAQPGINEPGSRSCSVQDYGMCSGDSGGNCCDPDDVDCKYSRQAPSSANSPAACSDSSSFAVPVFSAASFANDPDGLAFGSAVVQVTPSYDAPKVLTGLSMSVPIPSTEAEAEGLAAKWYVGSGSSTSDKVTNWEQDKSFTCLQGYAVDSAPTGTVPYTYGASSVPGIWTAAGTSLRAKDTVFFTCWMLPQQLQKCCDRGSTCCNVVNASDATNDGGSCCVGTACTAAGGTCTNMTVDPAKNSSAIVYRPYNVYFHTVAGSSSSSSSSGSSLAKRFCDDVPEAEVIGGEARVFFNGAVRPPDRFGDPMFAYEPNPFRSPFDASQGASATRLGVPVTFSLLHSADGTAAASGSYLAQFVQPGACSGTATIASSGASALPYESQCGWKALVAFWNKLAGSLRAGDAASSSSSSSSLSSPSFASFARSYYVYAVATRFLLALYQLAPCASMDGETRMSVAVFCTPAEWTALVNAPVSGLAAAAAGATLAAPALAGPTLQTVLDGLASSSLLASAQPSVSALQADGTVSVTLTIPALLRRFVPSALGALLLRAFPRSAAQGEAVIPDNLFDPAGTWDYVTAADLPSQDVFQVVDSSVRVVSYHAVGADGSVPTPSQTLPATDSTSTALLGLTVTFQIKAAPGSFTLLFYLYYLARNGNVPIDVPGLVAASEPPVQLSPSVLDAASAAAILQAGACTVDELTFVGAGAWRLNALLLGPQSQACKCLLPAGQPLTPETLCFNANCASRPPYLTVNLPSLLSATSSSSSSSSSSFGAGGLAQACPPLCEAYLAGLETGATDAQNVNDVALQEYCGVSLNSAQDGASLVGAPAAYLSAGVLACVAVPLLYLTVLAVSLSRARSLPFAATLAARPAFFIPCFLLTVLLGAAVAYCLLDWRGVQSCAGRSSPDADGFTYPASQCRNAGVLSSPFSLLGATVPALVPRYALPQEFCTDRASYCQCDNAAFLVCAANGCGCSGTQCCSTDGICTTPDLAQVAAGDGAGNTLTGASGRPLRLKPVASTFSFLTALLCICLALAIVPAAVAGTVCGLHASNAWTRFAAGTGVLVLAAAACFAPLVYRAAVPAHATLVGVGSCPRLADYPDTLVETTRPSIVFVRAADDDAAGLPTYTRTVTSASCAGCCASSSSASASSASCAEHAASTCATGCTCTWDAGTGCYESPPSTLAYSAEDQAWVMVPSNAALPKLYNAATSTVLFQDNSRPALYAAFTDANRTAANTYTFCGKLQGAPSCTSCVCASA